MSDDIRDIEAFYGAGVDAEDSRLRDHQLEFDLTRRYLDRHLPESGRVLEIGAATGAYTLELCRRGYTVTAVDLSEGLIDRCRERLAEEGLTERASLIAADARDLSAVTGSGFDAVLLMGPLYHLVLESDRHGALREAVARMRPGGVIFSAFLSRLGIFGDLIKGTPEWIERREEVASFRAEGQRPTDAPRGGFRAYFSQVSEIEPLMDAHGIDTMVLAAVEPAIAADDESYNRLASPQRDLWLDLLFDISTEPDIIGASRHLLHVGRKT